MKLRRFFCRHRDSVLQFEKDRMFLKCLTCGEESPGWVLRDEAPLAFPNKPLVPRKDAWFQAAALAGIIWAGPKLTPEQAAAILRNSPALSNRSFVCLDCNGPVATSTGAPSVRDFPPPSPPRRLDGTLLTDPPAVYVHFNDHYRRHR